MFRVLPNRSLDDILRILPRTKEELLATHGIGERKAEKYGKDIVQMVRDSENEKQKTEIKIPVSDTYSGNTSSDFEDFSQKIVSVGEFLDRANAVFAEMPASVRGEVSSADIRERYVFFTIKDAEEEASMSVFMWRREYDLCGVEARQGVEVAVHGKLDIYKPSGRLSFRAQSMALVGEGAIQAAYNRLKKQLEDEGLFASERKRDLPNFPYRIGLVTSKEGAVIHDFMSNIGRFGFKISFVNSRVEGALAVEELLWGIRTLKTYPIDLLVLIRGGGSLEGLAAFNNETLVREIANFPVPVICGIGHDKDVPLASLAADAMVSTPTAVTRELNTSWEKAADRVRGFEKDILNAFEKNCTQQRSRFQENARNISFLFSGIVDRCRLAESSIHDCLSELRFSFLEKEKSLAQTKKLLVAQYARRMIRVAEKISTFERTVAQCDPRRNLKLGYGIVFHKERVVRSVDDVSHGDEVSILLSDGTIQSKVHTVKSP